MPPVLDPSWQNPYVPSASERHHNLHEVRRFAFRRRLPQTIVVAVVVALSLAMIVVAPWLPLVGVGLAALYVFDLRRTVVTYSHRGRGLGGLFRDHFSAGGDASERSRLATVLDRLAATFGVEGVSGMIVSDPGYNAALVPDGSGYALVVTTALIGDFDLIELEGVVAHCLARQRLGLLERESLSAVLSLSDDARADLAGAGRAYRADEVAAASIRYPLGLAGALRRCASHRLTNETFFTTSTYAQWRWVFFDQWSDRPAGDLADLDDVELRARALEEW